MIDILMQVGETVNASAVTNNVHHTVTGCHLLCFIHVKPAPLQMEYSIFTSILQFILCHITAHAHSLCLIFGGFWKHAELLVCRNLLVCGPGGRFPPVGKHCVLSVNRATCVSEIEFCGCERNTAVAACSA